MQENGLVVVCGFVRHERVVWISQHVPRYNLARTIKHPFSLGEIELLECSGISQHLDEEPEYSTWLHSDTATRINM